MNSLFPGLPKILKENKASTLIIGANVFELYAIQNWIPELTRKTGDLDLSIGVSSDENIYTTIIKSINEQGYNQDRLHPYRFHPPKEVQVPGALTY